MPIIYESPDGGKTVYARIHEERVPLSEMDQDWVDVQLAHHKDRMQRDSDRMLWQRVLSARDTDPDIRDLLDQARTIYLLRTGE